MKDIRLDPEYIRLSQKLRALKSQMNASKAPHVYISSVQAAERDLEQFRLKHNRK